MCSYIFGKVQEHQTLTVLLWGILMQKYGMACWDVGHVMWLYKLFLSKRLNSSVVDSLSLCRHLVYMVSVGLSIYKWFPGTVYVPWCCYLLISWKFSRLMHNTKKWLSLSKVSIHVLSNHSVEEWVDWDYYDHFIIPLSCTVHIYVWYFFTQLIYFFIYTSESRHFGVFLCEERVMPVHLSLTTICLPFTAQWKTDLSLYCIALKSRSESGHKSLEISRFTATSVLNPGLSGYTAHWS